MSQTPAGWYPDANGTIRWWDGGQWTEHTQPPPAMPAPPTAQGAAHQTMPLPYVPQHSRSPWGTATPAERRARPWGIIVAGAVAAVIVIGLVLFFALRGGSGTSAQEFCSTLDGLPSNATIAQATSAVESTGLPDNVPADARHGFDLYRQYAAQLDRAGSLSNDQLVALVGGQTNLEDMKAFDTYVVSTCGSTAPQSQ